MTKKKSRGNHGGTAIDNRDANQSRAESDGPDKGAETAKQRLSPQQSQADASRQAKLIQRRTAWCWNLSLLASTAIVLIVVLGVCFASYRYHSSSTAQTLLVLAETAESESNYADQSKWLRQYSLLEPDNADVIYEMAIAADRAADFAENEKLLSAINAARKAISRAIARLGAMSRVRGDLVENTFQC